MGRPKGSRNKMNFASAKIRQKLREDGFSEEDLLLMETSRDLEFGVMDEDTDFFYEREVRTAIAEETRYYIHNE